MKKLSLNLFTITALLLVTFLAACQMPARRLAGAGLVDPTSVVEGMAATDTTDQATPTAAPIATAQPIPMATKPSETALAEQTAQNYFTAIEKGDLEQASKYISTYSLMVFNLTRGDAVSKLQSQKTSGSLASNLQITESRSFDAQTILVHVRYNLKSKDPKTNENKNTAMDELWPIRFENSEWRYNWNNLIDYRTLGTPAQTMNGITMLPAQILRFSDRIQLVLLVQNRTNAVMVFGQANETLATFHFGDQSVVAEKAQIILNPLRSVPDVKLEAKGLFTSFPETVEIRKWTTYNVKPWYMFQLQ